ncbi:MAG: phosphatidylserine decarboxylase [Polyangiaceae bacterium]|nr:phosphatidylserine decarboxylase [Polyangiaceae bacterium]
MSVATYAAAQLLRVLPRVRITRAVGKLADARIPAPLSKAVVGLFVRAYAVDLTEAIRPDGAFESFDAFFTRELVPGARPACDHPNAIVSPADGRLDALGPVERGGLLRVKGREYSAAELLGDANEAEQYIGGSFAVVYLSPRDYHRVHAPVGGVVSTIRSMPGDLFPVNSIGERHVPSLFSINRRVAIPIDNPQLGRITVVMVGAMIVGRITVIGVDERDVSVGVHDLSPARAIERGDEIGIFHLGSTAVVFAPKGAPVIERPTGVIRLGEALHAV